MLFRVPSIYVLCLVSAGCLDIDPGDDVAAGEPALAGARSEIVHVPTDLDRLPPDRRAEDPIIGDEPRPPVPVAVPAPHLYWTFDAGDRTGDFVRDRAGTHDLALPPHEGEPGRIIAGWDEPAVEVAPEPTALAGDLTLVWWGSVTQQGDEQPRALFSLGKDAAFEVGFISNRDNLLYVASGDARTWHRVPRGNHLFAVTRAAAGHYEIFVDGAYHEGGSFAPTTAAADLAHIGIRGRMDDLAVFASTLADDQLRELWRRADVSPGAPRALENHPFDVRR